jgi:hypothetical protein
LEASDHQSPSGRSDKGRWSGFRLVKTLARSLAKLLNKGLTVVLGNNFIVRLH